MDEFGDYRLDEHAALLPHPMSWFMEPFILASKKYHVYRSNPLNASAMWALRELALLNIARQFVLVLNHLT